MLEPNPWEASWKEVGQGDPNHFFGIQEDAFKMEVISPESILEKSAFTWSGIASCILQKVGKIQ
jgi:hypothetical protein